VHSGTCRDFAGTRNEGLSGKQAGQHAARLRRAGGIGPPLFAVEPYGGHVFLFRSKSGNYLKALHWDGTGLCLFAKRLERSRFVWPPLIEGGVVLTPAQFALLIEAMDWRRTVAPDPPRLPVQI
jgi:transposase